MSKFNLAAQNTYKMTPG